MLHQLAPVCNLSVQGKDFDFNQITTLYNASCRSHYLLPFKVKGPLHNKGSFINHVIAIFVIIFKKYTIFISCF